MRPLLSTSLATAVALLLVPSVHADDLVLELTTKLGVEKTVTVAKVDTGDERDATSGRQKLGLPTHLLKSDKKYLALTPPLIPKLNSTITHPAMLIAIPWSAIKAIGFEKGISTVTCVDGTFTGTILTEVTNADGQKYHLGDCTKVTVKKVTKAEKKDVASAPAKCRVRFDNLDQSFNARRIGYTINSATSEKFRMKVRGRVTAGNLSDFEKLIVKGSGTRTIQITVRPPKGKPTEGELVTIGNARLLFEDTNGCAIVLSLRDAFYPKEATFSVTIEATKVGERLPVELFHGMLKKKSVKR